MEDKEYSNVYAIPANYTDSGKLFGGMVDTRNAFEAVLDVLREERLDFDQADQGRTVTRRPWNEEERAFAAPWRERALEKIAEADEDFLDRYLGGDYTPEDVAAAVRRATLARNLTPTFCGSALRNAGVQPVLGIPVPSGVPRQQKDDPLSGLLRRL